jgi:tetraprenyl-beta-curcumene synthase
MLRADALDALDRKRANIDGAALFWILPRQRDRDLLRILIAYEVMADYLDGVSERGAHVGIANGVHLHRALVEAIDPNLTVSDHYRLNPSKDDGGYLRALVHVCSDIAPQLASYNSARPLILRAARYAQTILALNHEPDTVRRDAQLAEWAARLPAGSDLEWFEWTAAASAWLTILALLALAAQPDIHPRRARETSAAYLPWVCLAGTMLDSYGDVAQDLESDAHSYIAHYVDARRASERVEEIVAQATAAVQQLPDGPRHLVIVACMVAMYLSKDTVGDPLLCADTQAIAAGGGSLTRLLLPVLRLWRIVYRLRTA